MYFYQLLGPILLYDNYTLVSRDSSRFSHKRARASAILGGFGKSHTTVWAGKSVWNGLGLLSCNEPYPPNPTVNWISPLLNLKHARPHLQYSAFCFLSLSHSHILKHSHSHSHSRIWNWGSGNKSSQARGPSERGLNHLQFQSPAQWPTFLRAEM